MDNKFTKALKEKLDPLTIKRNLQYASLFLLLYEVLRSMIVDRTKDYFTNGIDDGKDILDYKYKTEILKLDKDVLFASAKWFRELGILDAQDIDNIRLFRDHRNILAHELLRLLVDINISVNKEYIHKMKILIEKIDLWWIMNFEIYFWEGVNEKDAKNAKSGNKVMVDYLFEILEDIK